MGLPPFGWRSSLFVLEQRSDRTFVSTQSSLAGTKLQLYGMKMASSRWNVSALVTKTFSSQALIDSASFPPQTLLASGSNLALLTYYFAPQPYVHRRLFVHFFNMLPEILMTGFG